MAKWTEEGLQLLETIALNAALRTGFPSSTHNVFEEARRITNTADANPRIC